MNLVKDQAMEIVKNLPDNASWDDLMYEFYAKQKIQRGLNDIEKGKVYTHEEVKEEVRNLMEIKWTESAINDIEKIRTFIEQDSIIYAEQFIKKIFDSIDKLLIFPEMGRQVKETNDQNIRELIFQNYRIIYLINRKYNQINIVSIFHCGRDMTKISKHPWEIM